MASVYTPLALKLHAFGLNKLHDPNWTGMELYDQLKRPVRQEDLLQKILERGFLFWLGRLLFHDYVTREQHMSDLDGEYLIWYLEDFLNTLTFHGADADNENVSRLSRVISLVGDIYERDEEAYFRLLESYQRRSEFLELHGALTRDNEHLIESVADNYAANYANRVFHDRALCGYVAELLVSIGFDGTTSVHDQEPRQWIERTAIPEWAKKAVTARERGKCAQCGTDLTQELADDPNVDHIVPLSRGGCNDLVNLQLVCKDCNLKKSNRDVPVTSSIPPYVQRRLQ